MAGASDLVQVARVAIRAEGKLVNAYLARNDTMFKAMLLGCISKAVCDKHPDVLAVWRALMQQAASAVLTDVYGTPPAQVGPDRQPPPNDQGGNC